MICNNDDNVNTPDDQSYEINEHKTFKLEMCMYNRVGMAQSVACPPRAR